MEGKGTYKTSDIEMAIEFGGNYYDCLLKNISEDGVLATIRNGDPNLLHISSQCTCFLSADDIDLECKAHILRQVSHSVALAFQNLEVDQIFALRTLIDMQASD